MDDSLNNEKNMHMSMKATKEVSMTKVLVTGGAGMLGREVVKQLTETGVDAMNHLTLLLQITVTICLKKVNEILPTEGREKPA